jgi:hypothetical protein
MFAALFVLGMPLRDLPVFRYSCLPLLGKGHGYADRGHREAGLVAFSGHVFP